MCTSAGANPGVRDGSTTATPPVLNVSDFLNLFVARTDVPIGAVIKALQQKNLLQILAEPNLITVIVYPSGDVNGNFTVTGGDSLLIDQTLVGLRITNDTIFQKTSRIARRMRWRRVMGRSPPADSARSPER